MNNFTPEAHKDHMRPDPELLDKFCYCLHCGQNPQLFGSCRNGAGSSTRTCGPAHAPPAAVAAFCSTSTSPSASGNVPSVSTGTRPPDNDFRHSNAKCPKCGSAIANGWFDDETDEEEDVLLSEELSAQSPPEENAEAFADEPIPWTDDNEEAGEGLFDSDAPPTHKGMADDIDFLPHERPESPSDGGLPGEDDIPW